MLCALIGWSQFSFGQELIKLINIREPKDTSSANAAAHALKMFLTETAKANKDNPEEADEQTGFKEKVITESRDKTKSPMIKIAGKLT